MASAPAGTERSLRRPPGGILVIPFVAGAGLVLMFAAGIGQSISLPWIVAAIGIGVLAATFVFLLVTQKPHPHHAALQPVAAPSDDPLAHVQLVEATGRQHRRPCANCGTPVKADEDKCPNCGHPQLYQCKTCKAQVRLHWTHCPECGRELH